MKKNYTTILMDLDGTITDPMEGITRCVEFALNHFGIKVKERRELCRFIGPPLLDSFQEFYGFSELQALEAIGYYRERFAKVGLYENEVYPGMEGVLENLAKEGKRVMVATSKPEIFARRILEYFQLEHYFSFIGGATLDGTRSRKEEVIRYLIDGRQLQDLSQIVMVGDRKYDILGAHQAGIAAIGVLYGYGAREELEEASADCIVEDISQLEAVLLGR